MNEDLTGFYSSPPYKLSSCFVAGHFECLNLEARKSPCFPFTEASTQMAEQSEWALCSRSSFPREELQGSFPISLNHMLELFSSMGVWWADTCMLIEKNFPLVLLFSHSSYHNRPSGKSRSSAAAEVAKTGWAHLKARPIPFCGFLLWSKKRLCTGCIGLKETSGPTGACQSSTFIPRRVPRYNNY